MYSLPISELIASEAPGLSSLLSSTLSSHEESILRQVLHPGPRPQLSLCDDLSALCASRGLPEAAVSYLIDHIAKQVTPTLDEGQVLIVSRRALRDTPERSWLRDAVFHHPLGASIVLAPVQVKATPPLRLVPFSRREEGVRAAPLFAELAWGGSMGFEEAWIAAAALTSPAE